MSGKEHEDQQPQEPERTETAIEDDDEDAVEAHMPWGAAQPEEA